MSDNADSTCRLLLEAMTKEYGGSETGILALGKWGGRELGLRSDLDFIFVTPAEPQPLDQKIARRFLAARISEPHRGGAIYSVDMRLRPSGNAGPLLVSSAGLREYLENQAAPWERQAYLRSRLIGRSGERASIDFHPAQVASSRGLSSADEKELEMIRSKLFIEESMDELDFKLTTGGLADVEFTAQIALLRRKEFALDPSTSGMIQYLEGVESSWQKVGATIHAAYQSLRKIEQLYQLTTRHSGSKIRVKSEEFNRLALLMEKIAQHLNFRYENFFKN